MNEAPEQLNPLSEMLALSCYGNTKNIIVAVVETSGPFDEQAAKLAVQRTAEKFTRIRSCIKEIRKRGKHRLVWEHRPDLPLRIFATHLENANPDTPLLDCYLNHLAPYLDRHWDLFQEPAIEFVDVASFLNVNFSSENMGYRTLEPNIGKRVFKMIKTNT